MRKIVITLLSVAALGLWNRPACAQVLYGSIVGTVQDESGAAVPNATISMVDNATTQSRATVSSDEGAFALTDVAAGSYTLTVTAKGFRVSRTILATWNGTRARVPAPRDARRTAPTSPSAHEATVAGSRATRETPYRRAPAARAGRRHPAGRGTRRSPSRTSIRPRTTSSTVR